MTLKRVGIWSAGRTSGALYAALGFIFGAILALVSLLGAGFVAAAHSPGGPPSFFGIILGVGAIVFLPVFYGLLGLIMGMTSAGLYNILASLIGGLELEMEGQ